MNDKSFELSITPELRSLTGRALATTAVRWELVAAGATGKSAELNFVAPLSRALGLTVAEVQRLSGFARQTIYNALNHRAERVPDRDSERLARLTTIALVATGRALSLDELGASLGVAPEGLVTAARALDAERVASFRGATLAADVMLAPTEVTEQTLRLRATEQQLANRAPGFTVYIALAGGEEIAIDDAAREVVGLAEGAVLPQSVAPSVMSGPELGLSVRATDQRSALRAAARVWDEIRSRAGLAPAPMQVMSFHPPTTGATAPSAVLDAFTEALVRELDEEATNRVRGERERYVGGDGERSLAMRCLTEASRQLRRVLGRDDADAWPTIRDGDDAFQEYGPVSGLANAVGDREAIRRPLEAALRLGAERLGPYRGGELGSFKAPGAAPGVPREVSPSREDLAAIASLAGEALSAGFAADPGSAVNVVRRVMASD
jgi:hypothetical protein